MNYLLKHAILHYIYYSHVTILEADGMKGIIALFGGTFLIILMSAMLTGLVAFRSTSQSADYDVTTAAGATSANVTLILPVLDADIGNITSVTSNITTDAPLANTYTDAIKRVLISGLDDDAARRLTVVYRTSSLNSYLGADIAAKWWPLFLVLGIIAVITAAIINGFREHSG